MNKMNNKFLLILISILIIICSISLFAYLQESSEHEKLQIENKKIRESLENYKSTLETCFAQTDQIQQDNEQITGTLQVCQNTVKNYSDQNIKLRTENNETRELLQNYRNSFNECSGLFENLNREGVIDHFTPNICGSKALNRISTGKYIFYKSKNHSQGILKKEGVTYTSEINQNNVKDYITVNDSNIKRLSREIPYICKAKSDEEKAESILKFVHSIPYEKDADTYAKYPIETLAEGSGDCEDLSILTATLMKAAGLDAVLFSLPGHVAVGVSLLEKPQMQGTIGWVNYNGKRYYYCETTGTIWPDDPVPWKVGQIPEEYAGVKINVLEI